MFSMHTSSLKLTIEEVLTLFENYSRCHWGDWKPLQPRGDIYVLQNALMELGTKRIEQHAKIERIRNPRQERERATRDRASAARKEEFHKRFAFLQTTSVLAKQLSTKRKKQTVEKQPHRKKPKYVEQQLPQHMILELKAIHFSNFHKCFYVDPHTGLLSCLKEPGTVKFKVENPLYVNELTNDLLSPEVASTQNQDVMQRISKYLKTNSSVLIYNGVIMCIGSKFELDHYMRVNELMPDRCLLRAA